MFKKFLIIIIISLFYFNGEITYSAYSQTEIKLFYDKFYLKLSKKISDQEKKEIVLNKLNDNINNAVKKTKNQKKIEIYNYLIKLNNEKLKIITARISIKSNQTNSGILSNNTVYEEPVIIIDTNPLIEKLKPYYNYVELNDKFEFYSSGFYRINFRKYYEVDEKNHNNFIIQKIENGYLLRLSSGKFVITDDYIIEKKYSFQELKSKFKTYIDTKTPYSNIGGIYYGYKYSYYLFFEDNYGLYLSDIEKNNINLEKTLFIKDGEKYIFSNDFTKVRLVSENFYNNIKAKNEFLYNLLDDNRFYVGDYEEILTKINNETLKLTTNLNTDEEKIKAIYDWIIKNIDYYKNYSDGNKSVFSGILTFENKTGVCDGYTKLFSYMLSFAGVNDVEIIRGYAIDSLDFPSFGHAWIRIGENYYDPTFDDPIGGDSEDLYMYYSIPKELISSNRFEGFIISEDLKNKSLNEREKIVLKNMHTLYKDYQDYTLMSKIKNRIFLGLDYSDNLTIDKLSKSMKFYTVSNNSYMDDDLKLYNIKSLNYYAVTDENIEKILLSLNYDISNKILFKWYDKDGKISYRLAYNIITY